MKFSVIMPSYLGLYRSAAKDREKKIVRAIASLSSQTFTDWELIVVADGCNRTVEIFNELMTAKSDDRMSIHYIDKQKLFSGAVRNRGLKEAKGEFIAYLDIDDVFGHNHLDLISKGLNGCDWVWFNDIRYDPRNDIWYENKCDINKVSHNGTSNICHKRTIDVMWGDGYAHDYKFILQLKRFTNFKKIDCGEYYVCHVPNSMIGKGYDL